MWPTIVVIQTIVGLVLLLLGLFGDRARGRRRCPRCAYRIETDRPTDGSNWRCSECGALLRSDKQLLKTRRHWRVALLGLAMLVVIWGLHRRVEGKGEGWVAVVPTMAMLPILNLLDDHYRQLASDPDGGRLSPLAEVLLSRAESNRISWLDWRLLLLRIDMADHERIFAYPERNHGSYLTLHGEILRAADRAGQLSPRRAAALDELTHVEIDFVSPWVAGEPLPARLYLRDWRTRSRSATIRDADGEIWMQGSNISSSDAGWFRMSDHVIPWDGFVELPPPDRDGSLVIEIEFTDWQPTFFASSGSAVGVSALSRTHRKALRVPMADAFEGLPPPKPDSSLDKAIRQSNPRLVLAHTDPWLEHEPLGSAIGEFSWVELVFDPLGGAIERDSEMILALRFELWCGDELLGHASAWWCEIDYAVAPGESFTTIVPAGTDWHSCHLLRFRSFHLLRFRPLVDMARLQPLDMSKCRWRIVSDPLMVRRCLAHIERDLLRGLQVKEKSHYFWEGEVIIAPAK